MKGDRCQRHDEPFARLGVAVRYKPFSFGDINVLPIILQIKPDVPVFFEHTGACNSSTCSAEPWSWLSIHRHIVLCDSNGKYYVAKNIYVLFAYLMLKSEDVMCV